MMSSCHDVLLALLCEIYEILCEGPCLLSDRATTPYSIEQDRCSVIMCQRSRQPCFINTTCMLYTQQGTNKSHGALCKTIYACAADARCLDCQHSGSERLLDLCRMHGLLGCRHLHACLAASLCRVTTSSTGAVPCPGTCWIVLYGSPPCCAVESVSCCCLQGFASGDLEKDATAVRMFTDAGVELLLSQVSILASSQLALAKQAAPMALAASHFVAV